MVPRTIDVGIASSEGLGSGLWALAGTLLVALVMVPTLAVAADLQPLEPEAVAPSGRGDSGSAAETGNGLTLITPLDGPGAGAAGFAVPCLGLGAAEQPLSACLGLGGGLDRTPAAVGFGLHYGHEGWLHLGAGVGVQPTFGYDAPGGGLTWTGSRLGILGETDVSGRRLSGSLAALVDVNALTGLTFGGVRPFLGAGVSMEQVRASHGSLSGPGLSVGETTAHGMTWGATLGSNYAVSDGITLDFAYRYTGQEVTGPLDPSLGTRMGIGGASVTGEDGNTTNHGMSIGLRLSF